MRRRKAKKEQSVNHERWLVSYADFITLLFAFFVVMYAISSVNESKYKVLSESLEGIFTTTPKAIQPVQVGDAGTRGTRGSELALDVGMEAPVVAASQQGTEGSGALKDIADDFYEALGGLIESDRVSINENSRWVEVTLRDDVLFASGDAVPAANALPVLEALARVLLPYPNALVIEGFTDNVPVRSAAFPSNWELSAARAAAVARAFALEGLDPTRMAAVGYGEHQPIASNRNAEGRSRNRRVVLLIANSDQVRLVSRGEANVPQ